MQRISRTREAAIEFPDPGGPDRTVTQKIEFHPGDITPLLLIIIIYSTFITPPEAITVSETKDHCLQELTFTRIRSKNTLTYHYSIEYNNYEKTS